MAFNRYSGITPVDFKTAQTPLQPLLMALQARQKRFDTSYELADELYGTAIPALPQDRGRANQLVQGWRTQIDDMVSNASGDYADIYKNLRSLRRDIRRSLTPGGEGNAIMANRKAFVDAYDQEKKRLSSGKITQDQLDAWYSAHMDKGRGHSVYYKGVGLYDPSTGGYNNLNPNQIAEYTDISKAINDNAKLIESSMEEKGYSYNSADGKWYHYGEKGVEAVTPKQVQEVVMNTFSDPKITNLLQWGNSYIDPDYGATQINTQLNRALNTFPHLKQTLSNKVKGDPDYILQRKLDAMQQLQTDPNIRTMPGPTFNTPGLDIDTGKGAIKMPLGTGARGLGTLRPAKSYDGPRGLMNLYSDNISNIPPAHKSNFTEIYSEIHNDANLTSKQKVAKMEKEWDSYQEKLATRNTTNIPFDKTVIGNIKPTWPSDSQQGTWYEIKEDGSLSSPLKQAPGEVRKNPNYYLPNSINTTAGKIGLSVPVGKKKYIVVGTGHHDALINGFTPLQQLNEPYLTGNKGAAVVTADDGTQLDVFSEVDRDGELILSIQTNEGRVKLNAAESRKVMKNLRDSGAKSYFNDMKLSENFTTFGDPKQQFDLLFNN